MLPVRPAKAEPLLPVAEVKAYSTSVKPCGPALFIEATAGGYTTATAVQPRYIKGSNRIASIAILTSRASIFLPTYSGVRPTIRPATKIDSTTKSSMPYRPEPTPPTMISPSWMLIIGIMPPSAVKLSCMALTAPQEASVVITANSEDATMPKRTSLPSMLPPVRPKACIMVLPLASAQYVTATPARNSTPITARIAQPWRWLPTMRPNTLVSAAPSAKIEIICTKFDSAVGFSKGCAALALKKPPPLVPSILMAICDATGSTAMVCLAPSSVVASTYGPSVCGMPCQTRNNA